LITGSTKTITPLASQETAQEFLRVLAYPKFKLTEQQIHSFASRYLPYVERIELVSELVIFLKCRDVNDQKFIRLSVAGKADILVTGDGDLLTLSKQAGFAILTPAEYSAKFMT